MLDPSRVRAIIFDLDGTIVDSDDAYVHRLAALLCPLFSISKKHDEHEFARRMVMAAESPLNAFFSFLDRLSLDEWTRPLLKVLHHLHGDSYFDDVHMIPGAGESLKCLALQYPLAIVTAREQLSADAILRTLKIKTLFQCCASAGTCKRTKPHPAPVLWAAEQLGFAPQDCLMVGDTPVDIRAGCAAGTQTIGVLCGFGEHDELLRAGADLVIDSIAELSSLLLGK